MPLTKSPSPAAFKSNLKAELSAGKPQKQALAIAYDVQRRGRADGGKVAGLALVNSEPTEAQKEAGNYKKAHTKVHGLDITIENPRGSERSGVGRGGKKWSVTMPDHYGYIKRTEGSDGDHVDCYIGRDVSSGKVYIVDQIDAETGKFDEHKCMLGYPNQKSAVSAYERAFSDGKGRQRIGSVTELSVDRFKDWLKSGKTMAPMSNGVKHIPHRAAGGNVPWFVKQEASHLGRSPVVGPVRSITPGRADKLPVSVPAGAYILPSQAVSHLGQGNTESGFHVADKMFHVAASPKPISMRRADGGEVQDDTVPIMISGGEYSIHPDKVREIGGGDLDKGHEVLDRFVKMILKNEAKTVARLPGPARD